MDDYQQPSDLYAEHMHAVEEAALDTRSSRQQFIDSVTSESPAALVKRYVATRRALLCRAASAAPTYGDIRVQMEHCEILRKEILRRIKAAKAAKAESKIDW